MPSPGRGWVWVRAPQLSAESIIAAMESGDFYASTGVKLDDLRFEEVSPMGAARPSG